MSEELHDFINMLTTWHEKKVTNLRSIAEGTGAFTLKCGDDVQTELTDREAALFRAGMETVLMDLGNLPFTVSIQNEDEEDEQP